LHKVWPTIVVPGREDTLIAEGEYDASDLWGGLGDEFERPILFDFDSAVVKPASYPIINELVDAMLSQPRLKLEIQGHTDNVGTMEYNQILSEQRAQAVFNEIVKRGVDPRRLRWRGFGKTKPVANNQTEEGRQRNRRTVFVILAK
jgi:OOP family OmpA-OmpF porin